MTAPVSHPAEAHAALRLSLARWLMRRGGVPGFDPPSGYLAEADDLLAGPLAEHEARFAAVQAERDEAQRQVYDLRKRRQKVGPDLWCRHPKTGHWHRIASGDHEDTLVAEFEAAYTAAGWTEPRRTNPFNDASAKAARLIADNATLTERVAALEGENASLQTIISDSAAAIGNGACIGPGCTLEFMAFLPREIAGVAGKLRAEVARLTKFVNYVRMWRDRGPPHGNPVTAWGGRRSSPGRWLSRRPRQPKALCPRRGERGCLNVRVTTCWRCSAESTIGPPAEIRSIPTSAGATRSTAPSGPSARS